MLDFLLLAQQCAPVIDPQTLSAVVRVESNFNPYAIGVVGGRLQRQPKNRDEALATANYLHQAGWNFSVGLGQVNRYNLPKYNIDYSQAFEPCHNLRVSSLILNECLTRATPRYANPYDAMLASFSCYYSGNFTRGFKPDGSKNSSYVERVLAVMPGKDAAIAAAKPIPVIADKKNGGSSKSAAGNSRSESNKDPGKNGGRISGNLRGEEKSSRVRELRGD